MIVILKNVRISYPDIWKPGKPMNEGDTPKYGGQFIFSETSEAAKLSRETLMAAARETFGENWQAIVGAMDKTKKCVRRGNDNLDKQGSIRDGYKDQLYLVARNKAKPLIIDARRTKDKGFNGVADGIEYNDGFQVLTEANGRPYGGCYVNVKVDIKAMKAFEKVPNQIYATLLTVQYAAKGEAFGAAPGTAEGFDDEDNGEDAAVDHSQGSGDPLF